MPNKIDTKKQITKVTYNGAEVPLPNTETAFEEGKKAEYDTFWDTYQENGNRTDYQCAFAGVGWNNDTFKPKHKITPRWGGATNMFKLMTFEGSLKEHLNNLCVTLDLSQILAVAYLFSDCTKITELPDIDLSGVTSSVTYAFYNCTALTTVKITLPETVTALTNSFKNCSSLTNLTIEGVIPCNIDVSPCPLTHDSIESIINALSTTTSGLSVTLSKTAVETAFGSTTAAEWTNLIGTKTNWTINLV